LKAFCLAFAFLLASLPASAEELPRTSNAYRADQSGPTEPGNYEWTVIDDATGGAQTPAAATDPENVNKSAPARAALAKIRAETQRVTGEAEKAGRKVSRILYDLRVRCVVEEVDVDAAALAQVAAPAKMTVNEDTGTANGTLEFCEVDYSQKVRSRPQDDAHVTAPSPAPVQPEPVDFKVAFPVD